ncbi:hypothetical protein TNCV_933211 [Trichonephila clavipes]|nr:hypothetical protein TNCV_933211 [Trichonephila clavipes]
MSGLGGQSEARPQCLSPRASLVLIYRPTAVGIQDCKSTFPKPGIEPGLVVWKRDGHLAGSGGTRFFSLSLYAEQIRHHHPSSATNRISANPL